MPKKFKFFTKDMFKDIPGDAHINLKPSSYKQLYYDMNAHKGDVVFKVHVSKPKKKKKKS